MFKTKKGVTELIPVGLGIGVFAIVLSVVALILQEFLTQMTSSFRTTTALENSSNLAMNITQKGLDALWTIAKFLGIIALALIGGFLIYVLVKQFSGQQQA
jgi:hypothetical protein